MVRYASSNPATLCFYLQTLNFNLDKVWKQNNTFVSNNGQFLLKYSKDQGTWQYTNEDILRSTDYIL